jgi:hypothetical protein
MTKQKERNICKEAEKQVKKTSMQRDNHSAMKWQDVCKVYIISPAHDETIKGSLQDNKTTLSNVFQQTQDWCHHIRYYSLHRKSVKSWKTNKMHEFCIK